MTDAHLKASLFSLRKWRENDDVYPLVTGAIAPVMAAIDEFTPETVTLLRDVAVVLDALPSRYLAAAGVRVIASHIERFLPANTLPSAELTLLG